MPVTLNEAPAPRSLGKAVWNGMKLRCPHCGKGHMFKSFLKVADNCDVCGEELFHHRADDGPAYLTILIVGHLMAPLMLFVFTHYRPEPLIAATIFSVGCVALSLFLLPRLKGAVVAVQWAKRMHGFGQDGR